MTSLLTLSGDIRQNETFREKKTKFLLAFSLNRGSKYIFSPNMMLSSTYGKSEKNNLRIISKPHAYLQTMFKSRVKFQRNRHKTVGGVAQTSYPLSIHFDSKTPRMAKFKLRKKSQKIVSG